MISLGVDIGGTGAKCVAFDDHGAQLALSYIEYPNPPGKANLEPQVLSDSVVRVIRDCVQALPARDAVAAITVSSFGESFVPIDEHGAPLTDIIMYFANSESGEFDELVRRVGEETFMRVARILPDASYSLAKMLYTLRTAQRPVWKFLPIAAYVCYRLSGAVMTDVSLACRTLLYDVEKREWSRELLEASGVALDQLPDVCPTGTAVGFLRSEIAQALGLPENVRVVIGSHDQIVNALACGVCEHGDGVDVSGTCECIEPLFAGIPGDFGFTKENFACVPYVDDAGYVTYAYNISGGAVVRWYRDQLARHLSAQAKAERVSVYDLLNRACPKEPTDVIVLPFLQGMGGTPDVRPNARGMFYGVTMETGLPEFYRAILEGLTFEMAYNLEKLEGFGVAPNRLYACGGGARSKVWLQIKADIWNREILPVKTEETGALGSAILGFAAVTGEKDRLALAKKFVQLGEPMRPDAARVEVYREKFQLYKQLRDFQVGSLLK